MQMLSEFPYMRQLKTFPGRNKSEIIGKLFTNDKAGEPGHQDG